MQDANWNVVGLREGTSVVERYEYDPYGTVRIYKGSAAFGAAEQRTVTGQSLKWLYAQSDPQVFYENPVQYAGSVYDSETCLTFVRKRAYSSQMNCWMQPEYGIRHNVYAYLRQPVVDTILVSAIGWVDYPEGAPTKATDALGIPELGDPDLFDPLNQVPPNPIGASIALIGIIINAFTRSDVIPAQPSPEPVTLPAPTSTPRASQSQPCKKTCAKDYPEYTPCSVLADYPFNTQSEAINALKRAAGTNNIKGGRVEPANRGPCCQDGPGKGMHETFSWQGDRVGSIVSCPCCQETQGDPKIKTLHGIR